jgi:hypothetical protein
MSRLPKCGGEMTLSKRLHRIIKGTISLWRLRDAIQIKTTLRDRIQETLTPKYQPEIEVNLRRWEWRNFEGVCWGGSFIALIYLDKVCFCGMSFDLIGRRLIVSQIHGVHLNRCRFRPIRRYWEAIMVRAACDLGYKTMLIKAEHSNSWPFACQEVRERLVKRLDDTAKSLGFMSEGRYWVKASGKDSTKS